jgi:dihydroorotate dehydrogenase
LELLKKAFAYSGGRISIVSTGGVFTGNDVFERLNNGASLVLVHSAFITRGPYCLEFILDELDERMKHENIQNISKIEKYNLI